MEARSSDDGSGHFSWTFLSNHAHVLVCIQADNRMRLRDMARHVGITERAVQRIIRELEEAGVVKRIREGRRNQYAINRDAPLRHPLESHCTVGQLMYLVGPPSP